MREIEEVLSDAAVSGNDADYFEFFRLARDCEFFFNVNISGEGQDKIFSVPLVQVDNRLNAILCFLSNDDSKLKKPFGGLMWEKILEMVMKMPQADGLLVQGKDSAWIAIEKKIIKLLLSEMSDIRQLE